MLRLISLIPGLALIALIFARFQTYEEPIKGKWPLVYLALSFASLAAAFINAKKKDKESRSVPTDVIIGLHVITGSTGALVIILKLLLPLLPQVGDSYR